MPACCCAQWCCWGAGQIYADLLSGAIILALAVWLWNGAGGGEAAASAPVSWDNRSPVGWALFGFGAGLLPWLHVKNLATAGLFGLFAAWQVWRHGSWRGPTARRERWGYAAGAALLLLGPDTFLWYEMTHGLLLGGQGHSMTDTPYLRVVEMLIGRHLDQSHGLFWHQPLFLPRTDRARLDDSEAPPAHDPVAAALCLPASTARSAQPLGRHHDRPVQLGRPLALADSHRLVAAGGTDHPRPLRSVLRCWWRSPTQAVLAFRWVPDPTRLFAYAPSPLVWARDSLFPLPVRYIFPHFYLDPGDGWWVAALPGVPAKPDVG